MASKYSLTNTLAQREFLAVFIVVVNALSWYFPLYFLFTNTVTNSTNFSLEHTTLLAIFGVHYIAVVGFAMVGTVIVNKLVSRSTLLSLWMLVGIAASVLMTALEVGSEALLFPIAFVLGFSLGLGFPSCLAYFADYGVVEHRGRFGGFTYCVAGLGIFLMGLLTTLLPLTVTILILTVWRGIGWILFILIKPQQKVTGKEADASYKAILSDRSFALYLVPWFMFCLINYLEGPILRKHFGNFFDLIPIAEFGIGSFVALVGGLLSDMVGRKRVVIFGYVMLGIGYAALGLFPRAEISWYFYIAVDGVAWGIFALTFFMLIWGELAENRAKDKYYFLGELPFLLSSYMEIIAAPYVGLISVSASFSLASFFLFLAVLPLTYAPETLPEKKIRLRQLRSYVEKAKKVREKYLQKSVRG